MLIDAMIRVKLLIGKLKVRIECRFKLGLSMAVTDVEYPVLGETSCASLLEQLQVLGQNYFITNYVINR